MKILSPDSFYGSFLQTSEKFLILEENYLTERKSWAMSTTRKL